MWRLGCVLMLACTNQPDLRVDMRTDYIGGVEFETAEVSLDDGPFEVVELDHRRDYLTGVRLTQYAQLDVGTRKVVVRLKRGAELVAERTAIVSLVMTSAVTVVLTRDCRGVACPAGDATATACLGGQCVDPSCNPETPDACVVQCEGDADCAGPQACSAGSCIDGVCLAGDSGSCGEGSFCHPALGCRPSGSDGCPPFMRAVDDFCIDVFQSGTSTWLEATEHCEGLGGGLCTEAQWVAACEAAEGHIDSLIDDWEWTATMSSETDAIKHGAGDCMATSQHSITDGSYGVRCCATR